MSVKKINMILLILVAIVLAYTIAAPSIPALAAITSLITPSAHEAGTDATAQSKEAPNFSTPNESDNQKYDELSVSNLYGHRSTLSKGS